jgi:phosphatidylglycerol lysyltransferase
LAAAAAAGLYGAAWLWARRQTGRAERAFPPAGEFVTVEGVPVHFVRRGAGRPVVLLHGSDGFLQDYSLTVLDQIAAEFDAVALDRSGHGYSGLPPGEPASAPVQARLIHATLQRLGIVRPLLVGHSWSGLLLLYYAWKYPGDVSGLVLLAPWTHPGRSGEPLLRLVSGRWLSRLLFPLFAPFKPLVVRRFITEAFGADPVPPEYLRQAEALWLRSPRQLAATARENSGNRSALGGFTPAGVGAEIPVVIVAGDRDRVTPLERQARRLKAELPGASLTIVEGAGHELLHAAPEAVLEALRRCRDLAGRDFHAGIGSAVHPASFGAARQRVVDTGSSAMATGGGSAAHGAAADALHARELVMRYGWNSAAYQILNLDIEHWFTADGEACVGFVTRARVRVVAGSPVCAEERLAEVSGEFEAEAGRAGETVCYFGAAGRLRAALLALPTHSTVPIGAQPAWNPAHWAGILKRHRSLRAQLNRARNKGVTAAEWDIAKASADPGLRRCFEEWHESHAAFELHFLTEPVSLDSLADRRVFAAERAGEPVGFLVATPVPERRGWLVEQIVRGSDAPNGTAELVIDALMRSLAAEGFDYVTLGLAPLSRRGNVPPRAGRRAGTMIRSREQNISLPRLPARFGSPRFGAEDRPRFPRDEAPQGTGRVRRRREADSLLSNPGACVGRIDRVAHGAESAPGGGAGEGGPGAQERRAKRSRRRRGRAGHRP